jgi:hypothetical protein
MENVDPKYRDFKEGENCYAVSNAEELKELLDDAEKIDTSKTVQNARKLWTDISPMQQRSHIFAA